MAKRWWIALALVALLAAAPVIKAQEDGDEEWQDAADLEVDEEPLLEVEPSPVPDIPPTPAPAPAPKKAPAPAPAAEEDPIAKAKAVALEYLAIAQEFAAKYLAEGQKFAQEYYAKALAYVEEAKAKAAKKTDNAAPPPRRRAGVAVTALHIDRRLHLENSWRRQQEREKQLAAGIEPGTVVEIRDLEHLESALDKAGSRLLVVCLYTSSCGACKAALKRLDALCAEASRARARAVFARHNLINEYDYWSDVSRMHSVRAVPTFLFFDGGALVQRLTLRDVRRMRGPAVEIQKAVDDDLLAVGEAFRRAVFKAAPGAR
ncbi:thioredoxin-like, chloroplastic [Raphidocelis subcapitata]|uniref:Thioredoxin-like, chloroplastic n=1 Tax=Raphidocelis subcapitata TaxID=307507 RepID=A0A2V0NWD7_9CHLO|nr:thioredoxin-like, chloroplastic [Raphidocelis subcapitata]|eukprot:GBF91936.1 thioredoxin-like, chloroplastic [Raphidocelis subcapitata]